MMENSGVTLLGYTPIPTDASYTPPQHFDPPPPMDTGVSPARTSAASLPIPMSVANMIGAGSPTSAFGATHGIGNGAGEPPPPYGAYSAVEPVVSSHYDSAANPYGGSNYNSHYSPGQAPAASCMTLGPYTPSQASSPAMSITGAEFDDLDLGPGFNVLSHSANPGPPPCSQATAAAAAAVHHHHHMMEPMLPSEVEQPPNKIKKEAAGHTFSSFGGSGKSRYGCGAGGAQTMPYSADHKSGKRGGRSKYSTRSFPRATSPMFPDQSTPLSSLSRQPSISSLSTSSTSYSAPAKSVRSDPGTYRHEIHTDSAIHSPANSLLDSPKFNFLGPDGVESPTTTTTQPESASRSCLEVEMPAKYSREIYKLDKKILELQAKRSKLLEKAKSFGTGPMPHIGREDSIMELHWNGMDKPSDIGKVLLYIFPLGIREFDEPVYEEANSILRQVGGLYFDLQRALTNLREICCKGSILTPEISTCFAYIHSLLNVNQRLKLSELANGIYKIQLDLENGITDGSVPHAQEFNIALNAANEVLMAAQHITQLYSTMQMNLQKVKQRASDKVANFEQICGKLGIVAGERKNHIRTVLEGYSSAVESAGRVWQQYYQVATDTISTITECIHPS